VIRDHRLQLESLQGTVDMIAGGPPCQGFSVAGRRNENDQRNSLITSYIEFIRLVKPKIIFFENVKGFTLEFKKNREKGKIYSHYVVSELEKLGYKIESKLVNFGDYGIPQKRTRFILVGIRKDLVENNSLLVKSFFEKLTSNKKEFLNSKKLPINPNLADAISDLLQRHGTAASADTKNFFAGLYSKTRKAYQVFMRNGIKAKMADSHRFSKHTKEIVEKFQFILDNAQRNKNVDPVIRDKYKIRKHTLVPLDGIEKCPTLTTLPDDYIHYEEPRILTVREYARIQTFPDWFEFKGKYTTGGERRKLEVPRYTQIGNAIPPLFGEQSGIVIREILDEQ
jgi:DNA (cytosine-5)-methyltransferase 1